mgnify:CR=1 FL=1
MPKIFISIPIGVTTKKKITPRTIGETILPSKIPNLNQILFSGYKIEEFINPRIKKIIDNAADHTLIFPSLNNGNIAIMKNNIKKTIPKLLFELIFILSSFKLY